MKLLCTNEDICGWAGGDVDDDEWICPVCASLALPLVDLDDKPKIPQELVRLLGYANTDLESIPQLTKTLVYDLASYRERAFAGTPQPYDERTAANLLSATDIKQLATINISVRDTHYHKGLLHTRLRDERGPRTPDIVLLHNTITHNVSNYIDDNYLHDLKQILISITGLLEQSTIEIPVSLCIAERDQLLAQIGSLFMPTWFYGSLVAPISFLENTAPAMGLFVMAVANEISS